MTTHAKVTRETYLRRSYDHGRIKQIARHRSGPAVLKTACALVLLFCSCAPALGDDAIMFRGNPRHTGVYGSKGPPSFSRIKWKFHTDGYVVSSPAVTSTVVYVGSTDGNLYAIDRETGALKWKFATGARVTSSPAVVDGIVYFESYDGRFYAVDAISGQLKWKFQTKGERRFAAQHIHGILPAGETMPDPFDCYLSSPVVWNGSVYFGSGDGNIYALDALSGEPRWTFHTDAVVHASPAIADGMLFVGSWDSYFYALDAVTGKEKWRFKTGDDPEIHNLVGIQSSAAVMDGVVYFGCRDANFYALDAATGKKRWAFNTDKSWVITSPAVRDGKVYFATSDSALFYALDAKSGAKVFSLALHWPMFSSPAIAGNMLYLGSHEGKLTAIDLTKQVVGWVFQTDASQQNGPSLTNPDGRPNYKATFVENFYDSLIVSVNKMQTMMGQILSSPTVVENVIYVGSNDGNLYSLM